MVFVLACYGKGEPTGGWSPHELRSIQDFYVRFGLSSAGGVSEVASIGGYVKEYQVDVDPEALRSYGISLAQVMNAIRESNLDIGAQTIEINQIVGAHRREITVQRAKDADRTRSGLQFGVETGQPWAAVVRLIVDFAGTGENLFAHGLRFFDRLGLGRPEQNIGLRGHC